MSDYLYHHGIKGQKWGVRRFQNHDGGLTAAGRLRYKVKGAVDKAKTNHAAKKEEKARIKQIEAERKKPVKYLTDDELRQRKARLQMEEDTIKLDKRVSELSQKEISAGKSFINSAMSNVVAPSMKEAGKSALTAYLTKKFKNKLGIDVEDVSNAMDLLKKPLAELNDNQIKKLAKRAEDTENIKKKLLGEKKNDEDSDDGTNSKSLLDDNSYDDLTDAQINRINKRYENISNIEKARNKQTNSNSTESTPKPKANVVDKKLKDLDDETIEKALRWMNKNWDA